jgi:hypothetical protein
MYNNQQISTQQRSDFQLPCSRNEILYSVPQVPANDIVGITIWLAARSGFTSSIVLLQQGWALHHPLHQSLHHFQLASPWR